jgi:hypothetical protein
MPEMIRLSVFRMIHPWKDDAHAVSETADADVDHSATDVTGP